MYGHSTSGTGMYGSSDSGTGVYGIAYAPSGATRGVYGQSDSSSGFGVSGSGYWAVYGESPVSGGTGVYGAANNGSSAFGVWGVSSSGYAGYFNGNVHVQGNLTKFGGSFKIDHPLDPANKYLQHSFVESPDMMNVYNGNITSDANGNATVVLPDYFEALNRDFRYQLTVIGQFAQAIVQDEITGSRFTIKTDKPNVKVSWQVTGIRQDAWANANRIPVEQAKPADQAGTYLYPQGFGQPETKGVDYARMHQVQPSVPMSHTVPALPAVPGLR